MLGRTERRGGPRAALYIMAVLTRGGADATSPFRLGIWNARHLVPEARDGRRTYEKLDWIMTRMSALLLGAVVLLEVAGTVEAMRRLRKTIWKRYRKNAIFCVDTGDREAMSAGMVMVVDPTWAKWTGGVQAIAEYVAAFTIRIKGWPADLAIAAFHGFNNRHEAFVAQLAAMAAWREARSGALTIGDANHVPCTTAHRPGASRPPNRGDSALRAFCRFGCDCEECRAAADRQTATADAAQMGTKSAELVMGGGNTHVDERHGSSARLDVAIASGLQCQQWRVHSVTWAERAEVRAPMLSDHALVVFESQPQTAASAPDMQRSHRARPIRTGSWAKSKKEAVMNRALRACGETGQEGAGDEGQTDETGNVLVELRAAPAGAGRLKAAAGLAERLVRETHEAEQLERDRRIASGGGSPRQQHGMWKQLLGLVQRLRDRGAATLMGAGDAVFHRKRVNLVRLRTKMRKQRLSVQEQAERVVREANKQELYWAGMVRKQRERESSALEGRLQGVIDAQHPGMALRAMWAAISPVSEVDAMGAVYRDDLATGAEIIGPSSEFFNEFTAIGRRVFERRARLPACVEAVRAFHEVFIPRWAELEAEGGGKWNLLDTMTDSALDGTLGMFRKDKGVGVDGFSLNHLWLMPSDIRRLYYEGLRECVRTRRYPEEWRLVLYVLLKKPGRDARFVGQRREIALLCQGFKLLTQHARRLSYKRLAGRIDAIQCGWSKHAGPLDAGMMLGLVIQQQARLKRPLYVLYIDIEQCFPNARIEAMHVVEAWYGLPSDVRDLSRDVLEQLRGRYDSEHGLTDEFDILEGVLMGCTLSPDRLRLMLNSVAAAICQCCKGVRLWGETKRGWCRRVAQALLADDWVGMFESDEDRYKAFRVWNDWSRIMGMPLGVDKLDKSVTSAIAYSGDGTPYNPPHRTYKTWDGKTLRNLGFDEAYKHVGLMRSLDACERHLERRTVSKGKAAVAKLKVLNATKKAGVHLASLVGNAVLGSSAAYYLATSGVSWRLAEVLERPWRGWANWVLGRERHSPRLEVYGRKAGLAGGWARVHAWVSANSALHATWTSMFADTADTDGRACVRSALAMCLYGWGCRSNPREWRWGHIRHLLEKRVESTGGAKHTMDAAMLVFLDVTGGDCGITFETEPSPGDPWSADCSIFRSGFETKALWEAADAGGLGLRCGAEELPWAGVLEVADVTQAVGKRDEARFLSYAEARKVHVELVHSTATEKAWDAMVAALEEADVAPCKRRGRKPPTAKQVMCGTAALGQSGSPHNARASWAEGARGAAAFTGGSEVGEERMLTESLEAWASTRRCPSGGWASTIRRAYGLEATHAAVETRDWLTDARPASLGAAPVNIVVYMEDHARRVWGPPRQLVGNAEQAVAHMASWSVGSEGQVEWCGAGAEPKVVPVVIQAYRSAHGLLVSASAKVLTEGPIEKRDGPAYIHVAAASEQLQRDLEVSIMEAVTQTVACDGGRKSFEIVQRDGSKRTVVLQSAAACRHDGETASQSLTAAQGSESYSCELAAQALGVAELLNAGGTVMIWIDASGTAKALCTFSAAEERARRQYFKDDLLAELLQRLQRHPAVVIGWIRSHTGVHVCEAVDHVATQTMVAEAARIQGALPSSEKDVDVRPRPHASASFHAARGERAFAVDKLQGLLEARLKARSKETVWQGATDVSIELKYLDVARAKGTYYTLQLVRNQRALVGDKRFQGRVREAAHASKCHCGMHTGPCTWYHTCFECQEPEVGAARQELVECMKAREAVITGGAATQRWSIARWALEGVGKPGRRTRLLSAADGSLVRRAQIVKGSEDEIAVRKLLGGLMDVSELADGDDARYAWGEVLDLSAKLVGTARCKSRKLGEELVQAERNSRTAANVLSAWHWLVVARGPEGTRKVRHLGKQSRAVVSGTWSCLAGLASAEEMEMIRRMTVGIAGQSCDRHVVKEAEEECRKLAAGSPVAVAVQAVRECYEEVEELWASGQARRWEPDTWAEYLRTLAAWRKAPNPELRIQCWKRHAASIDAVERVRWIWWLRAKRASALITLERRSRPPTQLDPSIEGWPQRAWARLASWARRRPVRIRAWASAWRRWLALDGRRGGWKAAAVPGRVAERRSLIKKARDFWERRRQAHGPLPELGFNVALHAEHMVVIDARPGGSQTREAPRQRRDKAMQRGVPERRRVRRDGIVCAMRSARSAGRGMVVVPGMSERERLAVAEHEAKVRPARETARRVVAANTEEAQLWWESAQGRRRIFAESVFEVGGPIKLVLLDRWKRSTHPLGAQAPSVEECDWPMDCVLTEGLDVLMALPDSCHLETAACTYVDESEGGHRGIFGLLAVRDGRLRFNTHDYTIVMDWPLAGTTYDLHDRPGGDRAQGFTITVQLESRVVQYVLYMCGNVDPSPALQHLTPCQLGRDVQESARGDGAGGSQEGDDAQTDAAGPTDIITRPEWVPPGTSLPSEQHAALLWELIEIKGGLEDWTAVDVTASFGARVAEQTAVSDEAFTTRWLATVEELLHRFRRRALGWTVQQAGASTSGLRDPGGTSACAGTKPLTRTDDEALQWDSDEEFAVLKLIGKRLSNAEDRREKGWDVGTVLYKVVWDGWPGYDSWEPQASVGLAAIEEYEAARRPSSCLALMPPPRGSRVDSGVSADVEAAGSATTSHAVSTAIAASPHNPAGAGNAHMDVAGTTASSPAFANSAATADVAAATSATRTKEARTRRLRKLLGTDEGVAPLSRADRKRNKPMEILAAERQGGETSLPSCGGQVLHHKSQVSAAALSSEWEMVQGGAERGVWGRRRSACGAGIVQGFYDGVPLNMDGFEALKADEDRQWAEEYAAAGDEGVRVVAIPGRNWAAGFNEARNGQRQNLAFVKFTIQYQEGEWSGIAIVSCRPIAAGEEGRLSYSTWREAFMDSEGVHVNSQWADVFRRRGVDDQGVEWEHTPGQLFKGTMEVSNAELDAFAAAAGYNLWSAVNHLGWPRGAPNGGPRAVEAIPTHRPRTRVGRCGGRAKQSERAGAEVGKQNKVQKLDGEASTCQGGAPAAAGTACSASSGDKRRVRGEGDGAGAVEKRPRRAGTCGGSDEGPEMRDRKRKREEQAQKTSRILRGASGPSS